MGIGEEAGQRKIIRTSDDREMFIWITGFQEIQHVQCGIENIAI
jgi:hypothetical protein